MQARPTPAGITLAEALALGRLDAHAQAALVARGGIDARSLVEAACLRAEHLDPALQALSHRGFAGACVRAQALDAEPSRRPFAGVPWLAKDSLDVPGMPSRGGSRSRGDAPALRAPPYVQRLDAQGLVAIGKSAMPEFGLMPSTEPLSGPVTRNPWSPAHSPGGSSGGAAAAVAAGIVPLAHGSDGAGSIRMPAACCGVVGLKPGRGAVVQARARHAIEDLLVSDVLLSRSVRDTAWAFAATHPDASRAPVRGADPRRLRIAVVAPNLRDQAPHPDVADALRHAADLCVSLGHHVEPARWPFDGEAVDATLKTLWSRLAADAVELAAAGGGSDAVQRLEPWTRELAHWHHAHCGVDALERAWAGVAELPGRFARMHERFDLVLSPVVRAPPPLLGQLAPDRDFDTLFEALFDWMSYTPVQNLAGTPAIALPLSRNAQGLPVGVQFASDRGREDVLLALAWELESTVDWANAWPPRSAGSGADSTG
ncbi:amidase family protein [Luteimonas saliphila]|uniref:amidase family protein n=1 Tax=Luteimonas saliphila TaxID=2804919 RepID=UPI00192DB4DD